MSGLPGYVADNVGLLVQRVLEHLIISGVTLAIAVLVALPVALWLGHTGRGAVLAVNASNIGRALPSLALIAIFLPVFGLNDRTTIAALVLLAIPPILTNTYTGMREVDRDVVEAARGMGMRAGQILRAVELPLALPVILAGIRTAAVQIIATATLGALIAGGGLGRFIVDGFAVRDTPQVLTGAVAVAVLAILTEVCLGVLERVVTPRGLQISRDRPTQPVPGEAGAVTTAT